MEKIGLWKEAQTSKGEGVNLDGTDQSKDIS